MTPAQVIRPVPLWSGPTAELFNVLFTYSQDALRTPSVLGPPKSALIPPYMYHQHCRVYMIMADFVNTWPFQNFSAYVQVLYHETDAESYL